MVKNTKGGNKGKKQGRKYVNAGGQQRTRFAEDADEIYACCQKMLGNGMFVALCHDKKERLCIIRNKFKGRGKRDNIINIGTWVLIGRRSFEARAEGKLEKCDLLEVYSDSERHKLKQQQTHINWQIFEAVGNFGTGVQDSLSHFDFVQENAREVEESEEEEVEIPENKIISNYESDDEIDIDDI
tara:strand:+ start:98 stop:652 length:555 start_codon:yes stop_codon:yes gene_type:complete